MYAVYAKTKKNKILRRANLGNILVLRYHNLWPTKDESNQITEAKAKTFFRNSWMFQQNYVSLRQEHTHFRYEQVRNTIPDSMHSGIWTSLFDDSASGVQISAQA